jgi:hypothetical protein
MPTNLEGIQQQLVPLVLPKYLENPIATSISLNICITFINLTILYVVMGGVIPYKPGEDSKEL